jgi:hypothetical protein
MNYVFLLKENDTNYRVCFELGDATTEQNNVKSTYGKVRQFMLDQDKPVSERKGDFGKELVLHFQYQSDSKKRKQKDINLATVKTRCILSFSPISYINFENLGGNLSFFALD